MARHVSSRPGQPAPHVRCTGRCSDTSRDRPCPRRFLIESEAKRRRAAPEMGSGRGACAVQLAAARRIEEQVGEVGQWRDGEADAQERGNGHDGVVHGSPVQDESIDCCGSRHRRCDRHSVNVRTRAPVAGQGADWRRRAKAARTSSGTSGSAGGSTRICTGADSRYESRASRRAMQ